MRRAELAALEHRLAVMQRGRRVRPGRRRLAFLDEGLRLLAISFQILLPLARRRDARQRHLEIFGRLQMI